MVGMYRTVNKNWYQFFGADVIFAVVCRLRPKSTFIVIVLSEISSLRR